MKARRQQGASQLEVVLVVILILILISTAIKQVALFSDESEKLRVEAVLDSVRTSINSLVSEHMLADTMYMLQQYDGGNPIGLLAKTPPGYEGVRNDSDALSAIGQWSFHRDRKHLVYRVKDVDKLHNSAANVAEISFRLNLMYRDKNGNQRYDQGVDDAQGLALESVAAFEWLSE
ncbi:MAG: hypothetical protein V7745_06565 [Pseudomonadales bacterium]